jgi:hypothetical protein
MGTSVFLATVVIAASFSAAGAGCAATNGRATPAQKELVEVTIKDFGSVPFDRVDLFFSPDGRRSAYIVEREAGNESALPGVRRPAGAEVG